MLRRPGPFLLALLVLLALPASALGHAERATFYPEHEAGKRPPAVAKGKARVVCKKDSRARVNRTWKGTGKRTSRKRRAALRTLSGCRYRHIQQAVDAARSGERILVLPGVYKEEPSRKVPVDDPKCAGPAYWEASGDNHQVDGRVPTALHQQDCPNARNLIAVIGDGKDDDRTCDRKCRLTIEGLGRVPEDVRVIGDRRKPDVIRADRADGFRLKNVLVEQGAYNNVDVVETNGFRLERLTSRWAQHYGVLTFTSDNGLYDRITAYGSGDSGVYPGSGPERHCRDYGIEVRRVNSYGNTLGSSGTAGNGTWTRDSRFHDNAAGIANDSFAPGHPGMPQDCSKWTGNTINSNNVNYFDDRNEAYCAATPFQKRRREVVCPVFQVVVGTGFMFYGVNENVISDNRIYDQHRNGIRQFGVPAIARGVQDPTKQYDTSHGNRYTRNVFGVRPDGTPDRNGVDVYWDEQGVRNCWQDNAVQPGARLTSDPAVLPDCDSGGSVNPVGNVAKLGADLPCVNWNPRTNRDPAGCTWFTTPKDPGDDAPTKDSVGNPVSPADTLDPVALLPLPGLGRVAGPGDSADAPLVWEAAPKALRPRALPADRLMLGRVRNASSRPLRLDGIGAELVDGAGRPVRGGVTFASGFTHGLYGPGLSPRERMPEKQARRMGALAVLEPGESTPVTIAWRTTRTRKAGPTTARLGGATLALPVAR